MPEADDNPGGSGSSLKAIGRLDDVCPYCNVPLKKRPRAKSKCPHCAASIYVRTRPLDRKKVLVTEQEAEEVDSQWDIMRPSISLSVSALDAYNNDIRAFAAKLNRDPSDPDLRWLFMNQRMLALAGNNQWGLYRNTRMDMAVMLQTEGRLLDAIRTFLELCYMDLNGPMNLSQGTDSDSSVQSGFSADMGFLAPAIVDQVFNLMRLLHLGQSDVKQEFIHIASRVHKDLNLPMAPEAAWERLLPDLADD